MKTPTPSPLARGMSETVLSGKPASQVLGALLPNWIDVDDEFSWGLKVRDILRKVTGNPNEPKFPWNSLSNKCCDNKPTEADQKDLCESVSLDGSDLCNTKVDTRGYYPPIIKVGEGSGEPSGTLMGIATMSSVKFNDVRNRSLDEPEKSPVTTGFLERDDLCTDTEESEVDGSVDWSARSHQMMNENNDNASVAEGGPNEVDMCLAKENTDTLQLPSEADKQEVAGHVRTRLRLAAKLMGARARQCKVAKRCPPVTSAFAREMERLTERSKLRRQTHEKSQHSEWLQETEVYDKLVSVVDQFQQLRTRVTKISPIEGELAYSVK